MIRPCPWPAESVETPLDSRGWVKETIRCPLPQVKAHVLPFTEGKGTSSRTPPSLRPVISFAATRAVVRQMLVNLGLRLKAENTHLVYVSCCSTVLQVSTPLPQLTCRPVPEPPPLPPAPQFDYGFLCGRKKMGAMLCLSVFLRSIWCFKNFPHSPESHSNRLFPAACS